MTLGFLDTSDERVPGTALSAYFLAKYAAYTGKAERSAFWKPDLGIDQDGDPLVSPLLTGFWLL